MNRKQEMDNINGHNASNERRLWHGTSGANISNINNKNFNRSYGGVHGMQMYTYLLIVWKKTDRSITFKSANRQF